MKRTLAILLVLTMLLAMLPASLVSAAEPETSITRTVEVNNAGYVTAVVYTGSAIDGTSVHDLLELDVADFEIPGQTIYSVFAEEGKFQLNVVPFKADNVVVNYTGDVALDLAVDGDYATAAAKVLRPEVSYKVQSLDAPLHAGPNICIDPESPTGYTVKFLFKAPEKAAIAIMEGRTVIGWTFEDVTSVQFNGDLALRNANDYSDTVSKQPEEYEPGYMRAGSIQGQMTQIEDGEWAGYWYYELPLAAGANQYWFYCNGSTAKWYPDPANPAIWGPGCTETNVDGVYTRRGYNSVYVPYDEVQDYELLELRGKYETPRTDAYAGTLTWEVIESDFAPEGKRDDLTRRISVYLPAGYDANRAEPYKTIYMTPAYDQDEADWFGIGSCQNVMDNLIAYGDVDPDAIIVSCIAARNNQFLGLQDTDGDGYWNFEGLFDYLIPYIEANYNVSKDGADRAIGGHYQTAGSLIKFLGNTEGRSVDEFGYYLMVSTGKGADIQDVPGVEKARYFFSNGSTERYLDMGTLPKTAAEYIYYQPPGGHDFNCWDQAVREYFKALWNDDAWSIEELNKTVEINNAGYVTAVVYTGRDVLRTSVHDLLELDVADFEIPGQTIYSVFAEEGKFQLNVVPFKADNVVVNYTGDVALDLAVDGDYETAAAKVLRPEVSYKVQTLDAPLHAGPNICIDPESPTGYTVKFLFKAPEKAAIAIMEGRTVIGWTFEDVTSVQFNGDLALRNANDYTDTVSKQPEEYEPGYMRAGSIQGQMTQIEDGEWAGYWYYELPLAAGANQYWFYCNGSTAKWYPDPANPAVWGPGCTETNVDGVYTRRGYNSVYVPYDEVQDYELLELRGKYETPRTDAYAGTLTWEVIEPDFAPEGKRDDLTRRISVYLPAGYDANRAEPYKTIYMTPAYDQDEADWFGIGSCQNVMDNLIAYGDVDPDAIIVSCIAARNNQFLGLQDTDGDGYWNFEGLFDYLIPYIEANYNVSKDGADRAIGGHYQTAGSLIKFLGNTEGRSVDEFGYYLMVSTGKGADIQDVPGVEKARYFFSNGSTERYLDMGTLPQTGAQYIYYQPPGGHDFNCWDQAVREYFKVLWNDTEFMLSTFEDIDSHAFYYDAVKWAVENGITNGFESHQFAPAAALTRAQMVTFLWRAAGCPEPTTSVSFKDVKGGEYYAKAVAWAVENGITNGVGKNKFAPNDICTRGQIVTFLWRYMGKPAASAPAAFTDVPADEYYADAVAWAVEAGITTGMSEALFMPNNDCTRAQAVTFLYRATAE